MSPDPRLECFGYTYGGLATAPSALQLWHWRSSRRHASPTSRERQLATYVRVGGAHHSLGPEKSASVRGFRTLGARGNTRAARTRTRSCLAQEPRSPPFIVSPRGSARGDRAAIAGRGDDDAHASSVAPAALGGGRVLRVKLNKNTFTSQGTTEAASQHGGLRHCCGANAKSQPGRRPPTATPLLPLAAGYWGVKSSPLRGRYLVDPASSYMLVSKIKPCRSKYRPYTAKLRMAH